MTNRKFLSILILLVTLAVVFTSCASAKGGGLAGCGCAAKKPIG